MMIARLISMICLVLAAVGLGLVPTGVAQEMSDTFPGQALLEDAAWYAEAYGVSLDRAVRRLRLQGAIGDLDAQLARAHPDTFAGLWVQHEPSFRVIVRFTDNQTATHALESLQGSPLTSLIELRPAVYSLTELEKARATAQHLARQMEVPVDTDINVLENRVEIYAVSDMALSSKLALAKLAMPEGVEIVDVKGLAQPDSTLTGGTSLSTCTGGFTVRAYNGELGISTAAHCSNTQYALGSHLPFRAEDQQGNQDVQWHSACDIHTVTNEFNSGLGMRACTGTRHRNNQAIGAYVCKYGMMTQRRCGNIESKSLSVSYVTSSASTFVRVDGGSTDLSISGDSGSPWFVENIAYGIHSGSPAADPNDAIYMPINYISSIGVSVLTSDPGLCNLRPNAVLTWSNPHNLRVDLDASGSSDPDGSIVSYHWNFGDGSSTTTTSPTVTHWYDDPINYFVSLRVVDDGGSSDDVYADVNLCVQQPGGPFNCFLETK